MSNLELTIWSQIELFKQSSSVISTTCFGLFLLSPPNTPEHSYSKVRAVLWPLCSRSELPAPGLRLFGLGLHLGVSGHRPRRAGSPSAGPGASTRRPIPPPTPAPALAEPCVGIQCSRAIILHFLSAPFPPTHLPFSSDLSPFLIASSVLLS